MRLCRPQPNRAVLPGQRSITCRPIPARSRSRTHSASFTPKVPFGSIGYRYSPSPGRPDLCGSQRSLRVAGVRACHDRSMRQSFDELVDEAERARIEGWDFRWLEGRAMEDRPSWRYFDLVARRARTVASMLDIQVGAGGMILALPDLPPQTVGTEGYAPNVPIAARSLRERGAHLVYTDEGRPALPFMEGSFELVTSRHPVDTWWDEIARVLRPGGSYLSQQVGPHSLREVSEFFLGPLPPGSGREPEVAHRAAESADLVVTDLRHERPRTEFYDVGAIVYFLRLVVWIVPGFTVAKHRERLKALHDQIERDGAFRTTASRFLIEARKP